MAESRLHIQSDTHLVEFPNNDEGWEKARQFRIEHFEFRRRRIKSVLQMLPSQVPIATIVART